MENWGRLLEFKNKRPKYSPKMPKQTSWMLPKNSTATSKEAHPMGVDGSLILLITTQKTPKNASAENNKPIKVTMRSGKMEKLTNMLSHKEISFLSV
jgi:hypothetical protein